MKISAKLRVVELRRNKQHKMRKQARTASVSLVPGVANSDGNTSVNRICPDRI